MEPGDKRTGQTAVEGGPAGADQPLEPIHMF